MLLLIRKMAQKCMINPKTGRAVKSDGKTAKAIKLGRFGILARGLANLKTAPITGKKRSRVATPASTAPYKKRKTR